MALLNNSPKRATWARLLWLCAALGIGEGHLAAQVFFANVHDLTNRVVHSRETVLSAELRGYYSAGDGGGGMLTYTSNSLPSDGGMVFASVSGGAWVRVYNGDINPVWFGAKGDGVADDWPAINAACSFIRSNSTAKLLTQAVPKLWFPAGRQFLTLRTIDARAIPLVVCDSVILADDRFQGTVLKVGDISGSPANLVYDLDLWVNRQTANTNHNSVGVSIEKLANSRVKFRALYGHGIGLLLEPKDVDHIVFNWWQMPDFQFTTTALRWIARDEAVIHMNYFRDGNFRMPYRTEPSVEAANLWISRSVGSRVYENSFYDGQWAWSNNSTNHSCLRCDWISGDQSRGGAGCTVHFYNSHFEANGDLVEPALLKAHAGIAVWLEKASTVPRSFIIESPRNSASQIFVDTTEEAYSLNNTTGSPWYPGHGGFVHMQMYPPLVRDGDLLRSAGGGILYDLEAHAALLALRAPSVEVTDDRCYITSNHLDWSDRNRAVAHGFQFRKLTGATAVLQTLGVNQPLLIVCYDEMGNLLEGSNPWYAWGYRTTSGHTFAAKTPYYRLEPPAGSVVLHPKVASGFIGSLGANSDRLLYPWGLKCTFGSVTFVTRESDRVSSRNPHGIFDPGASYRTPDGSSVGVCIARVETALAVPFSGESELRVKTTAGFRVGDNVVVESDEKVQGKAHVFYGTVRAVPDGTRLVLESSVHATGIHAPTGARVVGNSWILHSAR